MYVSFWYIGMSMIKGDHMWLNYGMFSNSAWGRYFEKRMLRVKVFALGYGCVHFFLLR